MFPQIEQYLVGINLGKIIKVRIRYEEKMKSGSLMLDCYYRGIRQKVSLKLYVTEDLAKPQNSDIIRKAVLARDKKEIALEERRFGFTLAKDKEAVEEDVYTAMANWMEETYTVESSLRSHKLALNRFKLFMRKKDLRIGDVTKNDLRDFRKWLIAREHRNYARHILARICVFFNKMEDEGVIEASPARRISITEAPKEQIVYLDMAEITTISKVVFEDVVAWAHECTATDLPDIKTKAYIANMNRKDFDEIKQAFLFQCFSGLRISDVRDLRGCALATPNVVSIVMKKTQRALSIPLHPTARNFIGSRITAFLGNKNVFNLPRSTDFSRVMTTIGKVAGIKKKLESRIARRTFASLLVQHNVSIYDASKMLGHSSVKMTEKHYAAVGVQHLQEELSKVPEFISMDELSIVV